MLRRKAPVPGRNPERFEEALDLARTFCIFVHGHSSMRFGKVKRLPAMQAEIFSWVAPQIGGGGVGFGEWSIDARSR